MAIFTCLMGGTYTSILGQAWVWANPISGTNAQTGKATAVDPLSGAVYVAGTFFGTVAPMGLTSAGQSDIILARYYPDGSLDWAIAIGAIQREEAYGLAADSSGAVYLTGNFRQTVNFGGTGPAINLTSAGNDDGFLAKFDSSGRGLWAVRAGANSPDEAHAVAVHDGRVYFTGSYTGNIGFSGTAFTLNSIGMNDGFVAQYDTSGLFQWAQTWGGSGDDAGLGLAANASGVFCTGFFDGPNASFAGPGPPIVLTNSQNGSADIPLVLFRASDGLAISGISAGGIGNDIGNDLAINSSQVFLGGLFEGTANFGTLGNVTSNGGIDLFLAAYNASTAAGVWLDAQGSSAGDDAVWGIEANDFNVWLTGEYGGTLNWGGDVLPAGGNSDVFVAEYTVSGSYLWSGYATGAGADLGESIALGSDAAYVTGFWSSPLINFLPSIGISLSGAGGTDMFLSKILFADPPPFAVNDTVNIFRDSTVIIDVQANDLNPGGNPLTTAITCPASNGTATLVFNSIQYVPNPGFIGLDSICYSICDPGPLCDTAMVYINVQPPFPDVLPPPNPTLSKIGSLIIPMDLVLQQDGSNLFNLYAYGLANALLQANIPIKWCIRSGKILDGVDFSAQADRVLPSPVATSLLDFRGGPLVIDSIYADSALIVAAAYNALVPSPVSVYRLQQSVTIDVRHILTHKPRIAIFNNGGSQATHQDYLDNAGFTASDYAIIQPSGAVFDSMACYTFSSEAGWDGATLNDTSETRLVRQFIEYGGNFLAQESGIQTYEFLEGFQTTSGVMGRPFFMRSYRNPDMPFLQVQGNVANTNGAFSSYETKLGSNFLPGTYSLIQDPSLARYKATARKVSSGTLGGICFYLGGQNYGLTNNNRRNARRMYLDAILVPPRRPATCNLNFASDVEVSKTILPGNYCEGDTVDFMIVVRNGGPGMARDVLVADTLTTGLTFATSIASQGSYNSITSQWTVGDIPYLGEDTLWLRAVIVSAGNLNNKAYLSVSEFTPDFNRANDTASVTFVSLPTPDPTINAVPPLCDNNGLTPLSAVTPGGIWSGTGVSGQNFDPIASGAGAFTVNYVVSIGPCSAEDSITVTVNPAPSFTLGNDTILCQGDSVILDPILPASAYAWNTTATTPTITVFNNGPYEVTLTDANTCSAADTIQVTFLPPPVINFSGPVSFCPGDSGVLDPNVVAANYLWSTTETSPTITVTAPGWYYVTVTSGSNCSAIDSVNVSLYSLPPIDLGADTSACQGDSITLSSLFPASAYLWNTTATTPTIQVFNTGMYDLEVTDANNCTSRDTIDVAFLPLPSFTLGNDTILCQGDSVILDPILPASAYAWNTSATTPTITVFNNGPYEVTLTDANTCAAADTIQVTFLPPPVINFAGPVSFCPGDSGVLDPNVVAANYLWSTTETTPTITVTAPGTYYLTATTGANCSAIDSVVVGLFSLPNVDLGADTSACQGDSIALSSLFTANSYLWSNGATTPSITVSNSADYILTASTINNCSLSDTINVSFIPVPVFSLGTDSTLCAGDSLVLDPNLAVQGYLWSTTATTPTITVFNSGSYAVTLTDANNCSSSDTLTATFEALPVPNIGGPYSFCDGGSIDLNCGIPAASYNWSTGATTQSITTSSAGNFAVTVTTATGCTGIDSAEVSIWALPQVDASNNPAALCRNGAPIFLNGMPSGGVFVGPGILTDSLDPSFLAIGNYQMAYVYTDSNGCVNADSFLLAINDIPAVTLNGLAPEYCISEADDSLTFSPPGGALTGLGATNTSFSPSAAGVGGPYDLIYAYTDSNGCSASATAVTTVLDLPTPADAGADQSLQGINFADLSGNIASSGIGTWSMASGMGTFSDPNDPLSVVSGLSTGENWLVWTISAGSCGSSADSMLILRQELVIPTGFSPNGDLVNDLYVVQGITSYSIRKMSVFNRWGSQVFASDQYNNDWSGTNQQGLPLADDTYFMVLDLGEAGQFKQTVAIKR